jgi:hypothetical protein
MESPGRAEAERDTTGAALEYVELIAALVRARFDMLDIKPQIVSEIWTGGFIGTNRALVVGNDHPAHRGDREVHETWRFNADRDVWLRAFFRKKRVDVAKLRFEIGENLDIAHDQISRYAFRDVRILGSGGKS